jgi:DmsE family decaheme c-type cytochrome
MFSGLSQAAEAVDWESLNPAVRGSTYTNSSSECLECHEEFMQTFAYSIHGRALPGGGCESCHGPMSKHMDAPRQQPPLVVSMKNLDAEQSASVCLSCHEGGEGSGPKGDIRMNWHVSAHSAGGNACVTCHNPIGMDDPVLARDTQSEVCFTCHMDKRAKSFRRSRHPVREGEVACSDCHNPHGSAGPTQLVKNTVNETCYQCHAEKRGPFLWEHAPVREDCTICHDPHGTTEDRMLKVRGPFLCQQCHDEGYHPGSLYSGAGVPDFGGAAQQLLAKNCRACHNVIHGSNHPSGSRFTR